MRATGGLMVEPSAVADTLPQATPVKRKRGKSLSRRTGQDGHMEKSGRWFVVRFWKDIPGQEKRTHVRERVCPISGPVSFLGANANERRGELSKQAERTLLNISKTSQNRTPESHSVSNPKSGC